MEWYLLHFLAYGTVIPHFDYCFYSSKTPPERFQILKEHCIANIAVRILDGIHLVH